MQNAAKFWDGIAAKYAKSRIKDPASYEYTLARTRAHLGATDRVLELGCGTGSTALLLAQDAGTIIATDLSQNMLDIGAAKAQAQGITNIRFQRADLAASSLPDGPFDVIMAFNLMHLIRDTNGALDQINTGLKPGGLFISKTPCQPETRAPLGYRLIRMVLPLLQKLGKAPFVKFMRITDWDMAVQNAGFEIIEVGNHPAHPPSRYLVARKV